MPPGGRRSATNTGSQPATISERRASLRSYLSVNINPYPGEPILHTKKETNINIRAAFVHVIGDLLQSVGVLVAAFVIYFKVVGGCG